MTSERAYRPDQITVARACELASISRSWYYESRKLRPRDDVDLQDEIEKIVTECEGYGYRRVTHELPRRGFHANHKRVLRIMREQSWLCKLQRRSKPTTQSNHNHRTYPNLLPDTRISGLNQVWVADITYIRLDRDFVFLAAILDAYSRKVVGWNLSRRLDVSLTLTALEAAIASRSIAPGLIHHSDQGVQYAATDYVSRAQDAGIVMSMSRRGKPTDNPQAESFFRTLKTEQVYLTKYVDFADAYAQIARFIEDVYNTKRLHSSIGYRPPAEFEELLEGGTIEAGHPGRSTEGAPAPEPPLAPAQR